MDKFATLEPVKLYASFTTTSKPAQKPAQRPVFLGRLPQDLHLLVLAHLPIPDLPAYAASSRALAALVRDGDSSLWKAKWNALAIEKNQLSNVLDELERKTNEKTVVSRASAPPTLAISSAHLSRTSFQSLGVKYGVADSR